MKRIALLAALCLFQLAGCWGPVTPTPKPQPKPPTPSAVTIIALYDAKAVDDFGIYADSTLDKFCDERKFNLRIHPIDVVDETGKTPAYLKPYVDAAKGKKLPFVVVAWSGTIKASIEQPKDAQAILALVEKTVGDPAVALDFWAGGAWRKLGALKPLPAGAASRWPGEGADEREPLIDESKWVDVSFGNYSKRICDQNGYSSCCPTSGNSVIEVMTDRTGLKPVKLSTRDIYSRIANGDNGSNLEDFWAVACKDGVCTTDFCAEQGWSRNPQRAEGYKTSRAKHRACRVTICNSWPAIASALQRHKPVHMGLMVGGGFSPNSDGIIGPKRGGGGGGHALFFYGMKKVGKDWYCYMQNSWGEGWGGSRDGSIPKGCCLIHPSWVEFAFGAFALSSIVSPSDEPITLNRVPPAGLAKMRYQAATVARPLVGGPVFANAP